MEKYKEEYEEFFGEEFELELADDKKHKEKNKRITEKQICGKIISLLFERR